MLGIDLMSQKSLDPFSFWKRIFNLVLWKIHLVWWFSMQLTQTSTISQQQLLVLTSFFFMLFTFNENKCPQRISVLRKVRCEGDKTSFVGYYAENGQLWSLLPRKELRCGLVKPKNEFIECQGKWECNDILYACN